MQSSVSVEFNTASCLEWVKKGVAKTYPEVPKLTNAERNEIIEDAKSEFNIERDPADKSITKSIPESSKSTQPIVINLDDEDDDILDVQINNSIDKNQSVPNIIPVITLDDSDTSSDSETNSDLEDIMIKPTDNMVVVAHINDDLSTLDIYTFNDESNKLYLHHDIILPYLPLCLEWLSYEPLNKRKSNLCAVGSMSPIIEIWDLDIINEMVPTYKLGMESNHTITCKSPVDGCRNGHSKAVIDISWNHELMNILASGSIDRSAIIWDIDVVKPCTIIRKFGKPVTCLKWSPHDSGSLLTGSYDCSVKLFHKSNFHDCKDWMCDGKVEKILWSSEIYNFIVATENGIVYFYDTRKEGVSLLKQKLGTKTTSSLVETKIKGQSVLITSSDDVMKIWGLNYNSEDLKILAEKNMNVGEIMQMKISPDNLSQLAIGGNKAENFFVVYDLNNLDLQTI